MRNQKKTDVPTENRAPSLDGRDENPEQSRRDWEAFFAAIEKAEAEASRITRDDEELEEAA